MHLLYNLCATCKVPENFSSKSDSTTGSFAKDAERESSSK